MTDYVVKERGNGRYVADQNRCPAGGWCLVQKHAARFGRSGARARAKMLGAVVVRLFSRCTANSSGGQRCEAPAGHVGDHMARNQNKSVATLWTNWARDERGEEPKP